jgi:hypothetical protein
VTQQNVRWLQQLGGADLLLDVCCRLVSPRYDLPDPLSSPNPLADLALPLSAAEAAVVKASLVQLRGDVAVISKIVAQPILEPLTPARLSKVSTGGCRILTPVLEISLCSLVRDR